MTSGAKDVPAIIIRPFHDVEARDVASWAYEPSFDLYNGDPQHFEDYLTIDEHGYGYYAILADGYEEVIGFCCFGSEARVPRQEAIEGVVDIGGGVRPDRLSGGLATAVFPTIIDFARARFKPAKLRTAVAVFNERSTRLCISAGFTAVRCFDGAGREFCEFLRPA